MKNQGTFSEINHEVFFSNETSAVFYRFAIIFLLTQTRS